MTIEAWGQLGRNELIQQFQMPYFETAQERGGMTDNLKGNAYKLHDKDLFWVVLKPYHALKGVANLESLNVHIAYVRVTEYLSSLLCQHESYFQSYIGHSQSLYGRLL